jgi:hypothetical protein
MVAEHIAVEDASQGAADEVRIPAQQTHFPTCPKQLNETTTR